MSSSLRLRVALVSPSILACISTAVSRLPTAGGIASGFWAWIACSILSSRAVMSEPAAGDDDVCEVDDIARGREAGEPEAAQDQYRRDRADRSADGMGERTRLPPACRRRVLSCGFGFGFCLGFGAARARRIDFSRLEFDGRRRAAWSATGNPAGCAVKLVCHRVRISLEGRKPARHHGIIRTSRSGNMSGKTKKPQY